MANIGAQISGQRIAITPLEYAQLQVLYQDRGLAPANSLAHPLG